MCVLASVSFLSSLTNASAQTRADLAGWSAPVRVGPGHTGWPADLAIGASGVAMVAWAGNEGLWVSSRSAPGTWEAPVLVAPVEVSWTSDAIQLSIDRRGEACVLYGVDDRSIDVACTDSTGAFGIPQRIGRGRAAQPRLTVDNAGTWTAGWVQRDASGTRRVTVSRRTATGSWTTPRSISRSATGVGLFNLATTPRGLLTAVWAARPLKDPHPSPHIVARQRSDTTAWSGFQRLSPPDSASPAIVAGPGERLLVAWVHRVHEVGHIQAGRYVAGTWRKARTLNANPRHWRIGAPHVASGGRGQQVAGWDATAPGGSRMRSVAAVFDGRAWQPPGPLTDLRYYGRAELGSPPVFSVDAQGRIESFVSYSGVMHIRHHHRGAARWVVSADLKGADSEDPPAVASDPDGSPAIVWTFDSSPDVGPKVLFSERL